MAKSTRIQELVNPGKSNEHLLPEGHDRGLLWRLYGYWFYEERDGGVYVECESLSLTRDVGAPPTWPVAGSGDNATAVGLYSAIVTALYRRQLTGKGSYVTTSLLSEGVWSASVSIQAALSGADFFGLHDRRNPANAAMNAYQAADGRWFVLIVTPDKLPAVANAIGRGDLLTDPRFATNPSRVKHRAEVVGVLAEVFRRETCDHWIALLEENDIPTCRVNRLDGTSDLFGPAPQSAFAAAEVAARAFSPCLARQSAPDADVERHEAAEGEQEPIEHRP